MGFVNSGGQLEIRTLGGLPHTRVPGERLRPLGQLSKEAVMLAGRNYIKESLNKSEVDFRKPIKI